ncbi:hypothetical protein Nepgr_016848 [Nepenthes gracilis]|uniref:F-box domain-containing protein n=1 Tax=Nepenthes gracilis TaxID=150966 RepID=A0AAD3SQ31_NEPGR|nr:hypothetical protein Nepgr_016848 [Nepenthes gracilis]
MDSLLCDELLVEIFHRLPPSSYSSLSLVSKRWFHLSRLSTTSFSLLIPPSPSPDHRYSPLLSLSTLLSRCPFISFLSLSSTDHASSYTVSFDQFLMSVSSSCPNLRHLRFLAGPVSVSSLAALSSSCVHLNSLTLSLSRPLSFSWVASFHSLKELCIVISASRATDVVSEFGRCDRLGRWVLDEFDAELQLESLSVSGIAWGDVGMGWLWRNCKKLKKLQLRSCEGLGDGGSFSSFSKCLYGLREVELRTCRSIVDGILLRLTEDSTHLTSLLVYDGGSREGMLRFINQCRSPNLHRLDLRLPLDLSNDHLAAMAINLRNLSVLSLQSCCLVTGEGLRAFSSAASDMLQELGLINCDVVERVPGLLATLGQNLRRLRRLDLSYNEMLVDKELTSMLISCGLLVNLKLRGCKGLTNATMASILRNCKCLESVDIMHCCGIEPQAVEMFLLNSPRLRSVYVDQSMLSDAARILASTRCIQVVV